MNSFLYFSTVLIWGSTWLAIYFQLGDVPVTVSVFYRFALAAILLMPILVVLKRLSPVTRADQPFLVLQGVCLFSINFLCFYTATQFISSGLVSVMFSLATLFNAVNNRIFYKERIALRTIVAAALGATGLVCLFWPELQSNTGGEVWKGIGFAALGTLFFSLGNMISKRHSQRGIAPITTNAYGMFYGAVILIGLLFLQGQPLVISAEPIYWGSLLYLSVIGSIAGFTTYLMLVARVGPNNAAYATVMFPIIALVLSSLFEGFVWTPLAFLGIGLTIIGNLVIFQPAWLKRWLNRNRAALG